MKLTIWQFVALIAALVAGYLIYSTWFSKQDQGGWIQNFNKSIQGDESRVDTTKKGDPAAPAGSGGSGDAPAEPPVNVW